MSAPIKTLTLLQPAARTALPTIADQNNFSYSALTVAIDITAVGTGGNVPALTFTVQGKDLVSGKYFNIAQTSALAAVGTTFIQICPEITAAAAASAGSATTSNDNTTLAKVCALVPKTWRVVVTGTAGTATYSVGAELSDC